MNKQYVKQLAEVLVGIDSNKLAEGFLSNILTPSDLEEISIRLQIFKLLYQGLPQREVAKKLGVSIGTVSRGARELKYGKDGINLIFDKNGAL